MFLGKKMAPWGPLGQKKSCPFIMKRRKYKYNYFYCFGVWEREDVFGENAWKCDLNCVCDILCDPTGEGWSDELKLQSIDEDVDEDDLDEDGKERGWMSLCKTILRWRRSKFSCLFVADYDDEEEYDDDEYYDDDEDEGKHNSSIYKEC